MNNSKISSVAHPLPYYAEGAMSYIALSVFFLSGTVLGVYLPCKTAIAIPVRMYVLSVLSQTTVTPDLIRIAAGAIIPAVFCTLCAFTTFGAAIIPTFFSLMGFAVGQALSEAFTQFAADGLTCICIPFLLAFISALACWMMTGAQAVCASIRFLKLALGHVPARLPIFDMHFYKSFGSAIIVLLLTAVFFTSTYSRVLGAVF